MQSDCGKSDFLEYPGMLRAWIKGAEKYFDSHPNSRTKEKFGNAYNLAYHDLFCKSYEQYELLFGGLFGEVPDTKKFLENYFKIDLTI